jgi:uncharacterized protein YecE (DUF72 family)
MNEGLFSGLSGLALPMPKYLFPEEHQSSSRLTYYSTFFNSIEINSSFYKLPLKRTVENWVKMVPDDFRFTFKLWKEVTHNKNLEFKDEDVKNFFDVVSNAGKKRGCVLIQFPPSMGISNLRQFKLLLQCINSVDHGFQIAVEFRNSSWYDDDVYELLEANSATLVIHDIPKSRTPLSDFATEHIYLRFHGPTGNYRESYTESFLAEYATYVREWLDQEKDVYVYFNNTMGDAFENLRTLNRFVTER